MGSVGRPLANPGRRVVACISVCVSVTADGDSYAHVARRVGNTARMVSERVETSTAPVRSEHDMLAEIAAVALRVSERDEAPLW